MAEFVCFQIELSKSYGASEWREDIKGLMLKAGLYNTETVFLFSDTQVEVFVVVALKVNTFKPRYECAFIYFLITEQILL